MRITGLEALDGLASPAPPEGPFHPFERSPAPPTAAIDGSHAVLVDNGASWIVAVRAASDGEPAPETRIHAAHAVVAEQEVCAAYEARGLPAPRVRSAEGFAEAHRGLAEMDAAMDAIRSLPEGGLLLIDGALSGMPEAPQAIADRLLDRATASGLHIAGISKRSAISHDGRPLLPALAEAGRAAQPGCWWTPLAGHTAIAALLHPASRHAFRIDAETGVLPWLAHGSRDAVYRGYPYPLARAHNRVAIRHAEARLLRDRVLSHLGADAERFADFHAVLDRNVPR